jgi:hypothetical protein
LIESASERMYEVAVDGETAEIGEEALMSAWRLSVPDLALRVRSLEVGDVCEASGAPCVVIRRLL